MQPIEDLRRRAEAVDLSYYSTNEDQCDNCRFYKEVAEKIGYCVHKDVDMVVGAVWWCKLWAPAAGAGRQGQQEQVA